MAIGINPKHTTVYPLNGLPAEHFLILALEAARRLGWYLHYQSNTGLIATSFTWKAQVIIRIGADAARISSASVTTQFYDKGRNKANVDEFIAVLSALRASVAAEALAVSYESLSPYLPPVEADVLLHQQKTSTSHASDILAIFKPVKGYFVTPIILNINLLVFALMAMAGVGILVPDSESLINWGANIRSLSLSGQWWRMLTSTFLHIGIVHLLMNMYAFLLIGAQLEPRLGKARFIFAYLLTGIVASITSLYWHSHGISAGASGAIFGMYGLFLAMLMSKDVVEKANRKQLFASIAFFIVYNLLGGLQPGIDNAAHVGGLITGLVLGFAFVPKLKKPVAQPANEEVAESSESYY
jgi:rhomboid protease GluP